MLDAHHPPDDHTWIPLRSQRAPTGPEPEHTEFVVLLCECGVFEVFPGVNYHLVTEEWRTRFEIDMARLGFRLNR